MGRQTQPPESGACVGMHVVVTARTTEPVMKHMSFPSLVPKQYPKQCAEKWKKWKSSARCADPHSFRSASPETDRCEKIFFTSKPMCYMMITGAASVQKHLRPIRGVKAGSTHPWAVCVGVPVQKKIIIFHTFTNFHLIACASADRGEGWSAYATSCQRHLEAIRGVQAGLYTPLCSVCV